MNRRRQVTAQLELEICSANDADAPDRADTFGGGMSPLISHYLQSQRELTAVEKFSRAHMANELPAQARYYSSLLPAAPPGPGE